jgi:N-methylhydantoinase B
MPGGGGLGDPLARDPAAVQRDVAMGYVSREAARNLYKVVVDAQGGVDPTATKQERA